MKDRVFYVLGDTSYGECCLDDVNASHSASNDMIIHFGKCCLSTSSKKQTNPSKEILYVLPQSDIDSQKTVQQIKEVIESQFQDQVDYPLIYLYVDLEFFSNLVPELMKCEFSKVNVCIGQIDAKRFQLIPKLDDQYELEESRVESLFGRIYYIKEEYKKRHVIYIGDNQKEGEEHMQSVCTMLQYNLGTDYELSTLNPESMEFENANQRQFSKKLQQRYSIIEKVKDAEVIGILIGTVVVDNYMDIINNIRYAISKSNGKKMYEVLIGKLNEPKLKNFQFIDIYVFVGCPETSIIDPKKFNMSVATPHELFMALEPEAFPWESKIITDFNVLLPRIRELYSKEDVQKCTETFECDETSLALVKKEHQELVPIFSSQILQRYENLSYKGLEMDLDNKEVQKIQKGLTGIASSYDTDAEQHQQKPQAKPQEINF